MLSQNQSRYLVTIGFALLALLFASDLLLKPPKELVSLAISCISALYFTATLFVGLKEGKKRSRCICRRRDHSHCLILYLTHW
ncbi:hypothetical protein [Bacteroides eggerthii]|uniref:hypothetical protein n=1 Tax=Bacteroides eggerthii TaxID=28111 RepID=UPI001C376E43|nr:hypothetical protein [Bacteroides eggerthii]MBV4019863.1 hypothetical protein [Bacteroides eggerthii]